MNACEAWKQEPELKYHSFACFFLYPRSVSTGTIQRHAMTFRGNLIQTSFPPFCSSLCGWCTNVGALAAGVPTHKCTCLCQLDRSYHKPTILLKWCSNWCPTALLASFSRYRSASLVCVFICLRVSPVLPPLALYDDRQTRRFAVYLHSSGYIHLSTLICLHSSV